MMLERAQQKNSMRLYTTFDRPPATPEPEPTPQASVPSSRWGLFFQLTSGTDAHTSALLLETLEAESSDPPAAALRNAAVPSWRLWSRLLPGYASHYRTAIESGPYGVPGLCAFVAARRRWLDAQVVDKVFSLGVRQVVVLGERFDTRCARLSPALASATLPPAHHALGWFHADDAEGLAVRRAALATAGPDAAPALAARWARVDWNNLATLIPALTAAGFDPGRRAVFLLGGLLQSLDPAQAQTLLADVAVLCAPGSFVLLDVLHEAFFKGVSRCAGFDALAAALANKGRPLRSALPASSAALARALVPHHLRVEQLLSPADLGAQWQAGRGGSCGALACSAQGLLAWEEAPLPRFFSLAALAKGSLKRGKKAAQAAQEQRACDEALYVGEEPAPGGTCFLQGLSAWFGGRPATVCSEEQARSPPAASSAPLAPVLAPCQQLSERRGRAFDAPQPDLEHSVWSQPDSAADSPAPAPSPEQSEWVLRAPQGSGESGGRAAEAGQAGETGPPLLSTLCHATSILPNEAPLLAQD